MAPQMTVHGARHAENHMINAVGGSGPMGEPRNFGGLGPASSEASKDEQTAPLPPRTGQWRS